MKSEQNGKETKRQNITEVLFSELLFNIKAHISSGRYCQNKLQSCLRSIWRPQKNLLPHNHLHIYNVLDLRD